MTPLRFSDWELIERLLEKRELELRLRREADFMAGMPTPPRLIREYNQVCECLELLLAPQGKIHAFSAKPSPSRRSKAKGGSLVKWFSAVASRPAALATPRGRG